MTAQEVADLVKLLEFLNLRQRKAFLRTATPKQMRLLEVACLNLAKNHNGLTEAQIKTLTKFKRGIKILASKGYSIKDKRAIVTQKGGFIHAILPIIASLAGSMLPSLLSRS